MVTVLVDPLVGSQPRTNDLLTGGQLVLTCLGVESGGPTLNALFRPPHS